MITVDEEVGLDDVTAGASSDKRDENVEVEKSSQEDDNVEATDDVDDGKVRPRHFDKNMYTFSATAGRSLQQQASNIRNLV